MLGNRDLSRPLTLFALINRHKLFWCAIISDCAQKPQQS